MNKDIKAPVLFMVFNRPEKTKVVFDVIRSVKPKKLYIHADAPRQHVETDRKKCGEVRNIVTNVDWECDVKYLFHEKNLGCSLAGKTAWDWIFESEEEMIFIEDDGLVSRSFFGFCDSLLERYRSDERIAYIGGVNYGITYGKASYFFSRTGCGTYAMATWKRVHNLYEYKLDSYDSLASQRSFKTNFVSRFAYDYCTRLFKKYVRNGGNTYDLQMVYLVNRYNMFNIVPNVNLCTNIGFDEEASNTAFSSYNGLTTLLGRRERHEIDNISHPSNFSVSKNFEKKYFRFRVFLGDASIKRVIRFYYSEYRSRVVLYIKNVIGHKKGK